MANYLDKNEKFHIFSKSPVLSSMAVSQAVNKSGHTVSTNDVWADDVPWFTEVADEAGAITRAADARYNDLILWGSDIYVRKGDKTNGASTGTTFAELWEKHTELTEARAYALGSVTTQTPTNIVTKTVEIKNASDKVVLKYHVGKQIDLLTTANNANVASTWAARMFIDGKVVDQFVSPTDKVFAGNPSTGYTTLVYTATAAGNKYGFVAEGEADGDFVNNAFAGIVQFNQSRNSGHKFAASVFEYVGDKLDTTLGNIREEIQDIVGVTMEGVVASVTANDAAQSAGINVDSTAKTSPKITFTGGSVTTGETKLVSGGTVASAIDSAVKITGIQVKVGSGTAQTLTPSNKVVTIEIPEVQAAVVSGGVITTDGFAKASDAKAIAEKAISTSLAGTTDGTIGKAISDVEAIANGVSQTVAGIQTDLATGATATGISEAKAAAKAAQDTADAKVASVTGPTTGLVTVTGDKAVTITVSDQIATKTNVSDAISDATSKAAIVDNDTSTKLVTAKQVSDYVASEVGAIEIPEITFSGDASKVGFSLQNNDDHYIHLATAAYTAATETGKIGTWTDGSKGYLVTGATVAAAIGDVNAKVDALHQTPQFKVVVVDGVTDLTKWQDSVTGGIQENYIYLVENIDAADGSYIEYIAYKNGETLVTERIGTTKTDLSGYAKSVKINGQTYNATVANAGAIDLGSVVTNVSWDNTAADHAANGSNSTYATLSSNGVLTLGIASATSTTKGISKMFTGDLATAASDVIDTAVSVKSAQAMYGSLATLANSKVADVTGSSYLQLAGIQVTKTGSDVVISQKAITSDNVRSIDSNTEVVENGYLDGFDVIDTNAIAFETDEKAAVKAFIPDGSYLKIWSGDMPNLKCGYYMFANCSKLESFCGDLSAMTEGEGMFMDCSNLTSFCGDLSSLTSCSGMFLNCKLDAESLECIADTLPTVTGSPTIGIGYGSLATAADAQAAQTAIQAKGWKCEIQYNA